MNLKTLLLAAACAGATLPAPAHAQNFLMNSAETINRGNFKIAAFPTILFAEGDGENETGLAARLGYGFTDRFDVEGKVAFFDGLKMYGADAEYWLVRGRTDVSLSGGLHLSDLEGEGADTTALDLAAIASRNVGEDFEVYVGGSLSFESFDDDGGGGDESFRRFYVVPGVEYRLAKDVDLLAEFGLGLTDESPNYFSFGAAFYIR